MPTFTHRLAQQTTRHRARPLVALIAIGACVTLAACGSSASNSSSARKSSPTSPQEAGAPGPGRFAALRACLQKQGITLPAPPAGVSRLPRTPGEAGPGGGAAGFQLPKGVTRAQYQAALKKCRAGNFAPGNGPGFNSPTARAALVKYASCLRQNGINVPAPNTTASGPVFNTKGIDTSSTKFKAAEGKCQSELKGVFPGGGAPRPEAPNGAPPSGGAAPGGQAGAAPAPFETPAGSQP